MLKAKTLWLQNHRLGVVCPFCGKVSGVNTMNIHSVIKSIEYQFRNEKSIKEFSISGLCQSCQDDFFGVD